MPAAGVIIYSIFGIFEGDNTCKGEAIKYNNILFALFFMSLNILLLILKKGVVCLLHAIVTGIMIAKNHLTSVNF